MRLTTELGLHVWGAYEDPSVRSKVARAVYIQPMDSLRIFEGSQMFCVWIDFGDRMELVSIHRLVDNFSGAETSPAKGAVHAVFKSIFILDVAISLSSIINRPWSSQFSLVNVEVLFFRANIMNYDD